MSYKKGVRLERELLELFAEHGFCVVRAAGSGHNTKSPDILVFKQGLQYGIEVKGHDKDTLFLSSKQMHLLKQWEKISCISTFVAWRKKRKEWRFIPLFLFKKTKKHYAISWKDVEKKGLCFSDLLFQPS